LAVPQDVINLPIIHPQLLPDRVKFKRYWRVYELSVVRALNDLSLGFEQFTYSLVTEEVIVPDTVPTVLHLGKEFLDHQVFVLEYFSRHILERGKYRLVTRIQVFNLGPG